MARIRTFKPEFFRSPDTAKASPRARILYLAMWSWADDEGIGETNIYGLLGFAFPDTDDVSPSELQRLLKEVRGSFGVEFYENRGRFYYAVPSWNSHQKTERRAAGRFPKPDHPDSVPDLRFGNSEESGGNSASPECGSVPGTGEHRNRGTEEVETTEVTHQGADDVAPPQKCQRHINNPYPPDCGGCAAANREFKAWRSRQTRRDQDELEQRRRLREIAANCHICQGANWIPDTDPAVRCTHQEAVSE